MFTQSHFKLGGLYQLTIDDLYEEECLKDIKQELQAIHGVRLQKAATEYQLVYVCKNGVENNQNSTFSQINHSPNSGCKCGYYVRFSIQFRPRRQIYKLRSFSLKHSVHCSDSQQAAFLRNKRMLSEQQDAIMKIVAFRRARGQQCSNPKAILNILCDEVGLRESFLYDGIYEESYKRKLKKRLDNLIAEAKRVQINPKLYLSAAEYKQLYKIVIPPEVMSQALSQNRSPKSTKKEYLTRNRVQIKGQQKSKTAKQEGKCKEKKNSRTRNNEISSATSLLTLNSEVDAGRINPILISFPEEQSYTARRTKSEQNEEKEREIQSTEPKNGQVKHMTKSASQKQEKSESPIEQECSNRKRKRKVNRRLFDF